MKSTPPSFDGTTVKKNTTKLDDLDRRRLAKIESLGGPLGSEELDRRIPAEIAELEARNAARRQAGS